MTKEINVISDWTSTQVRGLLEITSDEAHSLECVRTKVRQGGQRRISGERRSIGRTTEDRRREIDERRLVRSA
jgi:hypothetical protein